jgi:hypothetical protein
MGSGYSPQLLEGMNYAKLKAEVENLASSVGKAIKTEADKYYCTYLQEHWWQNKSLQFKRCKDLG